MQERQKRIIALRAPTIRRPRRHPPLRVKLQRIVAPQLLAAVDGRGRHDDVGAGGDGAA